MPNCKKKWILFTGIHCPWYILFYWVTVCPAFSVKRSKSQNNKEPDIHITNTTWVNLYVYVGSSCGSSFIFIPQYSSIMLDVVIGVETDGKEKTLGGLADAWRTMLESNQRLETFECQSLPLVFEDAQGHHSHRFPRATLRLCTRSCGCMWIQSKIFAWAWLPQYDYLLNSYFSCFLIKTISQTERN